MIFIYNINNQNYFDKNLLIKFDVILCEYNFYYYLYKNICKIILKYKIQYSNIYINIIL
jgi:hypothetical protein